MKFLQGLCQLLFFSLAVCTNLFGQAPYAIRLASARTSGINEANQTLGADRYLQRQRANPAYRLAEANMNHAILSYNGTLDDSYTLPVVFHIIKDDPTTVTDQDILDALKDLNDAFSKSGNYSGSTGANTRIQFCLAQKDPDGANSSGITRTISFFTNMDQDLEDRRLKNLSMWDPKRYVNIWYVTDIKSEILTTFSCSQWTRYHEAGYAMMPPGNDSTDGIVVSAFGTLLAHEMGHYLGLYHTFQGQNCANSNCATDGDMVCDTPPDASTTNSLSCNQPQNSCSSDTLSGFSVDVPDMISNFMDYGNDACHNAFTEGQSVRMRVAIASQRVSLLQNECSKPCTESSIAGFTRDLPYPIPGNTVHFTSTSSGATTLEWDVNGAPAGIGNSFSYSFNSSGKYKVSLKAYNADPSCFAAYTDDVIVSCGVTARFYPDKRLIASKLPLYPDSIYFTNRSVNAISYQWLMANNSGMVEQVVASSIDLNYIFSNPATYSLRLVASNLACSDTSEKFNFQVLDPRPDGAISFSMVDCYDNTKIKLQLSVCDNGYAPIPANTPVSFYDADPRVAGAHLLSPTFFLPDTVLGKCCINNYGHILDAQKSGLDTIFAVFNDNGSTIPVALPNTSLTESDYSNNIQSAKNFQYHVTITPSSATLVPGDTLQLVAQAGPGSTSSFKWTSGEAISCTDCNNPVLIADTNITKEVLATSEYDCIDSAFVVIKVPPADDYTITLDSIRCSKNDSLAISFSICNAFTKGKIPKGISVAFYDADPTTTAAKPLGPLFVMNGETSLSCGSFQHIIKGVDKGAIYAVVNDNGKTIPVSLPNDNTFLEANYANNGALYFYKPDSIQLTPADTMVMRNHSFPISIVTIVPNPSDAIWSPDPGYILSCYQCAVPFVTPYNNTVVKMEIINPYGCVLKGQSTISTYVGGGLTVPNAFTPNHDGRNDIFYVLGGSDVRLVSEFSIFNRWGDKIFQAHNVPANDPGFGWDGRFQGKDAEPGTYVYFVKVSISDGRTQSAKGTVTLIR